MSSPKSAADNVVYPLRKLGLINEDGALTDRGNKWRVDSTFADACQEMLDSVYPEELSSLTNAAGAPDKSQVVTWMQHKGLGGSNAMQSAATYVMIAEKTLPDASAPAPASQQGRTGRRQTTPKPAKTSKASGQTPRAVSNSPTEGQNSVAPVIHLDIQVHIPAAASADQIDAIFASMAKHLYRQ